MGCLCQSVERVKCEYQDSVGTVLCTSLLTCFLIISRSLEASFLASWIAESTCSLFMFTNATAKKRWPPSSFPPKTDQLKGQRTSTCQHVHCACAVVPLLLNRHFSWCHCQLSKPKSCGYKLGRLFHLRSHP